MPTFGEIAKCPDMVQWQRVYLESNANERVIADFEVKVGNFEALDLLAFHWAIHIDRAPAIVTDSIDIGLSVLEPEVTGVVAVQTHRRMAEREDMLYLGGVQWQGALVQSDVVNAPDLFQEAPHYDEKMIVFPSPVCLIRPPTVEMNLVSTSGSVAVLYGTIYYMKRGVAKTAYLLLKKYWQDAKGFFKTGASNEYDT